MLGLCSNQSLCGTGQGNEQYRTVLRSNRWIGSEEEDFEATMHTGKETLWGYFNTYG